MSRTGTDSLETRSGTDLKRLVSILLRCVFGVGLLAGAVYAFRNPLVSMEGGMFGIGFYVLFAAVLGVVALYTAYRKTTFAPDDGLVSTY